MTSDSDIPYMHRFPFGDDVVDRLLSGSLTSTTAPDGFGPVAALFEAATGPATAGELAQAEAFAAAAVAASAVQEAVPGAAWNRSRLKKLTSAKAVAVATTLALGFSTAAAAATGSLPGQGSSHPSSNAAHGQTTAAANHATTTTSSTTTTTTTNTPPVTANTTNTANTTQTSTSSIPTTGPANQSAQFGLCTAFLNGQKHITTADSTTSLPPQYSSTAFKALIAQNGSVAATKTYCEGVVNAPPTGANGDTNSSGDNGANGDNSQGKPATPGNSTTHNTSGGKPASTGPPSINTHANTTPGKPASSHLNLAPGASHPR